MAFSSVLLLSGSATAINAISVIQEKRDPYPAIIAGGILLVTLSFLNEWQGDMAVALAACFFVGTFLLRGEGFFTWTASLISAK